MGDARWAKAYEISDETLDGYFKKSLKFNASKRTVIDHALKYLSKEGPAFKYWENLFSEIPAAKTTITSYKSFLTDITDEDVALIL